MIKKKISVIGLGYIGLPTAALLASKEFEVIGVDSNISIVKDLKNFKSHIKEIGLDELLISSLKSGNLSITSTPKASDIFIITVPTPINKNEKTPTPNLNFVFDAVLTLIGLIEENNMIIIESTVPMGTTNSIKNLLKKNGINVENIFIAHCPERVLPGNIIHELIHNDRIIGGIDNKSSKEAADFYKSFVKGNIYKTEAKIAELCKLTENSFRDTNIAFANELSMICDKYDIDVFKLINLTNKHPRVNVLEPGPGVGGHCIPVDPWFIISKDPDLSNLMSVSRKVNLKKTDWVIDKILKKTKKYKDETGKDPIIALFGLTFKKDVDDIRESPSIQIIEKLHNKGLSICVVEPNIKAFNDFNIISQSEAMIVANILVFLVKHKNFETIRNNKILDDKILLDFCNQLN